MNRDFRKWLFSAILAGALMAGMGAITVRAQNPNEPPPRSRADQREDHREAKRLRIQIQEEEQRLDSDVHQFGMKSPQARADRQRLRQDRRRLKQLRRDQLRDERIQDRQ